MPYCYPIIGTDFDTIKAAVESERNSDENECGIYRLRLRNETGDGFATISRLVAPDTDGTLYIGTSESVVSRVDMLSHAIRRAYDAAHRPVKEHSCARAIGAAFISAFPIERLWIEITPFSSVARFDWFGEEWRILTDYYTKHGEWPPMNGIKPSRKMTI